MKTREVNKRKEEEKREKDVKSGVTEIKLRRNREGGGGRYLPVTYQVETEECCIRSTVAML